MAHDVRDYLQTLQQRITAAIESADGTAQFLEDRWQRRPASRCR